MGGDVASLAAAMSPYLSAAAGAYGGAVLAKVQDEAAGATVSLGRRLLLRIFGPRGEKEPLPEPLHALAMHPEDTDALAALRLTIRNMLTADPKLEVAVREMLAAAPGFTQIHTGPEFHGNRNVNFTQGDQTINYNNYTVAAESQVGAGPPSFPAPTIDKDRPTVPGELHRSADSAMAHGLSPRVPEPQTPRPLAPKLPKNVRSNT